MLNGITSCHILKCPTGVYSYVGSVPISLHNIVPATSSDIMGGRAWENEEGDVITAKTKIFDTEQQARNYAKAQGVEITQ